MFNVATFEATRYMYGLVQYLIDTYMYLGKYCVLFPALECTHVLHIYTSTGTMYLLYDVHTGINSMLYIDGWTIDVHNGAGQMDVSSRNLTRACSPGPLAYRYGQPP